MLEKIDEIAFDEIDKSAIHFRSLPLRDQEKL